MDQGVEGCGSTHWDRVELCCALAAELFWDEGVVELQLGLAEDDFGRRWLTRVWPGPAIEVFSKPAGSRAPYRPEWRFEAEELDRIVLRLRFAERMARENPESSADGPWATVL